MFSHSSFAQVGGQDEQLAQQYFNNGEFEKALPLYQKLYDKDNSNVAFYHGVYNCELNLQHYDDAVKFVKKVSKKFKDEPTYIVDWGNIYLMQGDKKSASAQFDNALKLVNSDANLVSRLANAFININQFTYAEQTYLKAKKNFSNPVQFNDELADIYKKTGDVASVISTYLEILEFNPDKESNVQNDLQELITDKKYAEEVQAQLYAAVQKNPDNNAMYDMLIWYFIQKKDFDAAFTQVKALDKRNHEKGERMFMFAQSAITEGYFDAAINAYNYIINEKGKNSTFYLAAKTGLINVMKNKIMVSGNFTHDDLLSMKKNYLDYFSEFGKNNNTLYVIKDYANLEARFLYEIDTAIAVLNDALNIYSADKNIKGNLKLDLGDYLLMKGEIWDATLLYSQVDKDFGDDALGEEARFKNAKLSYFNCDFEFAEGMLGVLKGSTSELVSNDAIALSVFLLDNSGMDSVTDAMCLYAKADLFLFQNQNDSALTTLDTLARRFPKHALADDIVFQKANIYLNEHDFTKAADYFALVDSSYSYDLLGDDALFHVAELYENQLHDKNKAMELYKKLIVTYKGSIYTVEARKRFRDLRGDDLN